MIISEKWLREWVETDLDAQGIADCLTNAGLEVDAVTKVAEPIDNLVVGVVIKVSKHPDADRLNITVVDVGDQQLDIVCGASNVAEGLHVAVALVGAKLPNGLKIKKAKVRGQVSNGMLCSASELGLEEHSDGIIELPSDARIGQRVDEYLQLDDSLIDIDLTPNRGDCLSVQGVARELKVLANATYRPVVADDIAIAPSSTLSIDVAVTDSQSCPRYLARVISGVDANSGTPLWMQEKLRRSGLRPISPIVDITNYVMLELGQPMHAFDLAKLHGKITVRQSQAGESITLLDESKAELDDQTLVIADDQVPIAIAGVMGGLDSAIDNNSTEMVLEAAHFKRKAISGKARCYGLHTDSSHRFERGVDPQLPHKAMQRATELVLQICGGQAGAIIEQSQQAVLTEKNKVTLRFQRLQSLLGMPMSKQETNDILSRIADDVEQTEQGWLVTPPDYRFDVERECDLIEEVARVKGYDSVPTRMPRLVPASKAASEKTVSLRRFRQTLVARDYQEAITYSFIDPVIQTRFDDSEAARLANPLADNMAVMRTSLLPGLMEVVKFNANRQQNRIRLFEIGAVYSKHKGAYKETNKVAGVITGPLHNPQWSVKECNNVDFYDIKSDVESLLSLTGSEEPFIFNEFDHKALQPGQQAKIRKHADSDVVIGYIGRLHPSLEKHYGQQSQAVVFELNLGLVLQAELPQFKKVSRFPSIKRDLSVVIADDVLVSGLLQSVYQELGDPLKKVVLFDVYQGEGVAKYHKSVSLGLELHHPDRTMIDDEAEVLVAQALHVLNTKFNAVLRS